MSEIASQVARILYGLFRVGRHVIPVGLREVEAMSFARQAPFSHEADGRARPLARRTNNGNVAAGMLLVLGLAASAGCGSGTKAHTISTSVAVPTNAVSNSVVVDTRSQTSTASAGQDSTMVVKDACSLLSSSDLQAALSGTVSAGDLTTAPGTTETICSWIVTLPTGDGFGAELHVYPGATDTEFEQQRRVASAPTSNVTGVGNKAYSERADVAGHIFDDLWVRSGTTNFRVEVLNDLGANPLLSLARTVITRL